MSWSRPDAVKLQERTYEHSGTSIAGNKPITIGQGYSTIAWIPGNERTHPSKLKLLIQLCTWNA
ncbi:hypothetical protein [Nostoc sp. NMS8]|uniref:hypothetical protein n=1 Tax=Nostoc sp. NMS8 TaxID=2815392 RepID=UPI0025D8AB52|nr:hypothetical protein [Nostoc sp. NMS8]MBN3960617.1 hypothetical protein [Nostoc sp. NMS8]